LIGEVLSAAGPAGPDVSTWLIVYGVGVLVVLVVLVGVGCWVLGDGWVMAGWMHKAYRMRQFVVVHYLMAVRLSTGRQAVHSPSGGWWYRWDNNRTKCLHRGEFRKCLLMASLKIAG
jgi:hypothetical protein